MPRGKIAAVVALAASLVVGGMVTSASAYPAPPSGCNGQNQKQTAPWYEQIQGVYWERTWTNWSSILYTGNAPGFKYFYKLNHSIYQLNESGNGYCRR